MTVDQARRNGVDGYPDALQPVPRVTLTPEEAAGACGVSLAHFKRHIQPELRAVRSGSLRLFPVAELARWADKQARLA